MESGIELFKAWTDRQKVGNDYIRAVAEATLKFAQAQHQAALTAQEMIRAKAMALAVGQLELGLKQLNLERLQAKAKLTEIEQNAKYVRLLLLGEPIVTATGYQMAWSKLNWFKTKAMMAGSKLDDITIDAAARSNDNFLDNRNPKAKCQDMPPTIENALQMVRWVADQWYVMTDGYPAQRHLQELIDRLNQSAAEESETLESKMKQQANDLIKMWQLPSSLYGSKAAKTIDEAVNKIKDAQS